jgi:hypothetical protein
MKRILCAAGLEHRVGADKIENVEAIPCCPSRDEVGGICRCCRLVYLNPEHRRKPPAVDKAASHGSAAREQVHETMRAALVHAGDREVATLNA